MSSKYERNYGAVLRAVFFLRRFLAAFFLAAFLTRFFATFRLTFFFSRFLATFRLAFLTRFLAAFFLAAFLTSLLGDFPFRLLHRLLRGLPCSLLLRGHNSSSVEKVLASSVSKASSCREPSSLTHLQSNHPANGFSLLVILLSVSSSLLPIKVRNKADVISNHRLNAGLFFANLHNQILFVNPRFHVLRELFSSPTLRTDRSIVCSQPKNASSIQSVSIEVSD